MPAPTNAITTNDVTTGLDQEFVANFTHDFDRLADILGIVSVDVLRADSTLNQYKVKGSLAETDGYTEGSEVAYSKYELEKVPFGEVDIQPYRKLTTAQAILKSGYEKAVIRTDKQFRHDLRAKAVAKFFEMLNNGTGVASGKSLQAVLAFAEANLEDKLEENGDHADRFVHFVNRQDIAAHLAEATVTTQTAFGMTYIENFLGVENIFVTNKVAKGTVLVTPTDNIHAFGLDFGSLAQGGLAYETGENGIIGIHHDPLYGRVSTETHAILGLNIVPEVTDYIFKGTISKEA